MAETQPGGMKEKEDVKTTALPAEVSEISFTSIQGGEKTAAELKHTIKLNQESMAQVLPITEETPTDVLEKLKKPGKPRHKKNKNDSNTTEQTLKLQPVNINKAPSDAGEQIHAHSIQEPSTSKMNALKNIQPPVPSAEHGVPEAISNQDSMTQVLPVIAEEVSTNIPGKLKKTRKPKQKKKKNNSNTTEQAIQMQPANINKASSNAHEKKKVHYMPETSEINPPKIIKPLVPSAEQGVPDAIPNQDTITQVLPVIAEEVSTNIPGKLKKTRKPKQKKKKNNSNTTEQAIQMQPANINKASSSAHEKKKVHFMPEPSEMNPPKIIKPLVPSAEQGVPDAIPNQDTITQVLPVIAEEVATDIPGKPKKPRKPRHKKNKNNSNTTEQAQQIQPANMYKALSNTDETMELHYIQDPSTSKIYPPRSIKTSAPSTELGVPDAVSYHFSMGQVLPVITEETSADILEKPKKQRKPRQKKKKSNSSTVEQDLQMHPPYTASSSAEENQLFQIQEPSTSNVKPYYGTNEMNKKNEKGHKTKDVQAAVQSKEHGQETDIVNNNITETITEKMFPLTENVTEEDEKPKTSKDVMQEPDDKAEGGAQTPVQMCDLPTEAVKNDDEKPQTSKDALKESGEKPKGNAEAQGQRHLLFFREFYDHSGRLCVRNTDEAKLYIDGLYSQVKLACHDHSIKDIIEEAVLSIMNDITIDFKDFRVPLQNLEVLFNRMHNIIFMRLYRIGLSELALIEISNIVAIYRIHFKRADDIRLLYSLL